MMRFFIYVSTVFLVGLLLAPPAQAQPLSGKITNSEANAFFDNCVATSHPAMNPDTQIYYCGCIAARLQQQMSGEDLSDLQSNRERVRIQAQRRLYTYAYAPCFSEPIKNLAASECERDPLIEGEKQDSFCKCMERRSGYIIADNGITIMSNILKNVTSEIDDPFFTFLESPQYQKEENKITGLCARLNTPKPKPQRTRRNPYNRNNTGFAPLNLNLNQ